MRRAWVAIGLGVTLVMFVAACLSGPSTVVTNVVGVPHGPGVRSRGCNADTSGGPRLDRVRTSLVGLPGNPFGVVTTADGRWSFVSLGDKVAIMSNQRFAPTLARLVAVPGHAAGEALTHDGRYLLLADYPGVVVLNVAALQRGARHPVLGVMSTSTGTGRRRFAGSGPIEVVGSLDDHFAFVSLEGASEIGVFDLHKAIVSRFRRSGLIGMIPVGVAPVGVAISPDGRRTYATSELAGRSPSSRDGTLSVIDLRRAESVPSNAVIATVAARCSPVRVAVSPDGQTIWVTARESNALLGFSAAKLTSDQSHAIVAQVTVGQSPVGLALVSGRGRIVVADSNRFQTAGASAGLTVIDPQAALAGKAAVLGTIPAGQFPREMAVEPSGQTLLVTNFASAQLEAVNTSDLP
jgi:DNA-binding beta-propeller fold protein YncE